MPKASKVTKKGRWSVDSVLESAGDECAPPGYVNNFVSQGDQKHSKSSGRDRRAVHSQLKAKKAWEIAKSPMRDMFITAFMLWLSGSAVNIFSISITVYSLINPIKAILSVSSAFKRFEEPNTSLLAPKLLFILLQLVALGIALYKANGLGLLPSAADWSSYLAVKQAEEISTGVLLHSR